MIAGLAGVYRTLFSLELAELFQYRAAMVIWLLGLMLQPLIHLVVWLTVAASKGGRVGDFDSGALAAYFLAVMFVNHVTFTWHMFEMGWRVRSGFYNSILVQPLHPWHRDVLQNAAYKVLTLAVVAPAVALLAWYFEPRLDPPLWAALAFVPVLALAFLLRFLFEWALGLLAFWITDTSGLTALYWGLGMVLMGGLAPLALLPDWVEAVASYTPFRWMLAFPVELILGRLTPDQVAGRGPGPGPVAGRRRCRHPLRLEPGLGPLRRRGGLRVGTLLRLLATFFRLGAMNELQYRTHFWLQLGGTGIDLGAGLFAVYVVYSHTDQLNGWQAAELIALLGVWTLMSGLVGLVVQPSMERLVEDVREGTLDFTLTKPEEAQMLVSIGQVRVWRLVDVAVGAAVIGGALVYLGRRTGLHEAAAFALTLCSGAAIIYSFWLMLSTVSFWFVRVGNILMVFRSLYRAARWPVTIYPGWMRMVLTFVVPVAFAVTVPAGALVGRLPGEWLAGTVAMAVVLLVLSRLFWRAGLRRYSGASA